MAYEGEVLDQCGVLNLDFSTVFVVAVSGVTPCGHLLVYVPSRGGYYFHVAKPRGYPMYMTEDGYRRYLREEGKVEWKRIRLTLPNPGGAFEYLEELMSKIWIWGVLPHNCVAFVEAVIRAGGGDWGSWSNCPAVASDRIEDVVGLFMSQLEGNIYSLYGVPR